MNDPKMIRNLQLPDYERNYDEIEKIALKYDVNDVEDEPKRQKIPISASKPAQQMFTYSDNDNEEEDDNDLTS